MMSTEEYMASLPRKRVGAGALFFDTEGKLLIVKPNYKDGWLIPGGTCDENESPRITCIREVKEETGLDISEPRLLCIDYVKDTRGYGDALQFIFYGGVLTKEDLKNIKLQEKELDEYRFVSVEESLGLLRTGLQKRLPECIKAISENKVIYLESVH